MSNSKKQKQQYVSESDSDNESSGCNEVVTAADKYKALKAKNAKLQSQLDQALEDNKIYERQKRENLNDIDTLQKQLENADIMIDTLKNVNHELMKGWDGAKARWDQYDMSS